MSGEIIYPYFLYRYVREWWNIYSFSIQNIRQFDAAFAGEQEPSRAAARVPRKTQEGREAFACRRLTMPDKRPGGIVATAPAERRRGARYPVCRGKGQRR